MPQTPSLLMRLPDLPKECDSHGNIEYKLKLINPTHERLQHLITQMKWRYNTMTNDRLEEGKGEALYEIGVQDDGTLRGLTPQEFENSLATLKMMASELRADVSLIGDKIIHDKRVVEVLVKKWDIDEFIEVKIAMLGDSDAGKSTLLGVLSHDEVDNGEGRARLNLLRHRHEIVTGRTSSISRIMIGFDKSEHLINFSTVNVFNIQDIARLSAKIISFVDTCGHPKYQKTTISGLTGSTPDYACLMVAGNCGTISGTSKEHLGNSNHSHEVEIPIMLNLPLFICITKLDVTAQDELKRTLQSVLKIIKSSDRVPHLIQNDSDIPKCIQTFASSKTIPIFLLSCVTGENISLIKTFLKVLPKPLASTKTESDLEYQVEEVFCGSDIGLVVGGVVFTGTMSAENYDKKYYIGPHKGEFRPITINSIHRQRLPIRCIKAGQAASCSIIFRNDAPNHKEPPHGFRLRRGQVILSFLPQKAFWEIEAELNSSDQLSHLNVGSQGVIFAGNVRQGAKLLSIESCGQLSMARFKFVYEPEWLQPNRTLLFRQGKINYVGKVVNLFSKY